MITTPSGYCYCFCCWTCHDLLLLPSLCLSLSPPARSSPLLSSPSCFAVMWPLLSLPPFVFLLVFPSFPRFPFLPSRFVVIYFLSSSPPPPFFPPRKFISLLLAFPSRDSLFLFFLPSLIQFLSTLRFLHLPPLLSCPLNQALALFSSPQLPPLIFPPTLCLSISLPFLSTLLPPSQRFLFFLLHFPLWFPVKHSMTSSSTPS